MVVGEHRAPVACDVDAAVGGVAGEPDVHLEVEGLAGADGAEVLLVAALVGQAQLAAADLEGD